MPCRETQRLWIRRGAALFGHTINDPRRQAQRSALESSRRRGCRKVTLQGFPSGPMAQVPISPPLAPTVQAWSPPRRVYSGDWAMWIIWYVAMVASLRAMGLAPSPVPVRTDEDRTPFTDI